MANGGSARDHARSLSASSTGSRQGQVDEAVRYYQEALRAKPRDAEAHHNLGHALAQQGRRSEAAEHFRRALAIKPGLREAQSTLDQILAGSSRAK